MPLDNDANGNNDQRGSPLADFLNFFDASIHIESNTIVDVNEKSVGTKFINDFNAPVESASKNDKKQSDQHVSRSTIVVDESKKTLIESIDNGTQRKGNKNWGLRSYYDLHVCT